MATHLVSRPSMKQEWRRWHRQWHGSVLAALRSPRSPVDALVDRTQPALSRIYGSIIDRKRRRESSLQQRVAPPRIPVLSVGNVTFGATGKTPFVQFLVDHVLKHAPRDQVPLLLSRGYGDDEWRMLAKQYPSCQLAVGGDRVKVGAAKVKELGGDEAPLSCVVLDDGLQQWRLAKDLEIVMVDALHPLGNGLLLPCGSLRELPREALGRADVVVIHHADLLEGAQVEALVQTLTQLLDPQRKPVVATSRMTVVDVVRADQLLATGSSSSDRDLPLLDGCAVLVVCGVGNPESVELVVKRLARSSRVELKAFPDHHAFSEGDVDDISNWACELQRRGRSVVVVTTEKDFARSPESMKSLSDKVDLRVLRCELELLHNAKEAKQRIDSCLGRSSDLKDL
jgi:tetraacyldisaccharide 4'-kinase